MFFYHLQLCIFEMADDLEVHNAIGKDVSNLRCCVACHSAAGSLKMKVLNCLHAMCVTCLGQHLSNDGTVSCFKCLTVAASGMPGVRLEESLADWPVQRVDMRGKEVASCNQIIQRNRSYVKV